MTDEAHSAGNEALFGILQAGDEEARISAVRRLGAAGPGALSALIEVMGDESYRVRREAVRVAIAWPDGPQAAAALVEALGEPNNVGRRNAALEAVVALGPLTVAPLLAALEDRPEHRKVLVDALGALRDVPAERLWPALCAALADEDPNVRAAAAEGLGNLSSSPTEVVAALSRTLQEDRDLVVRLGALEGLNRHRVALPVALLAPLLRELVLRPAALYALGRSGDEAALPLLLDGLLDRARGSREAALRGLCDLHAALPAARSAIEEGVRRLSEPALRSTIRALLEATPDARAAAATLLRFSPQPGVVRPLVLALLDQHEAVSYAAAETLAAMGDGAVEVLCDLLPELDLGGRAALLSFFARTGATLRQRLGAGTLGRLQALLCDGLSDRSAVAAGAAARALGVLGGREALRPLLRAAATEGAVAAAADQALQALGERFPEEMRALRSQEGP